ncbi:cupin domain-containing protein [Limibacillus halophilus]|uniref:Quercetin dioxygenase-like cupin family protein n=1 Tax=Limibacillus halophilus TaxID=1579333 RepID=A0A839SQT5_9PROT|nr:cupin domain-containing protein [Limibacillus halophilus]MBB3064100.1 quercetin dioxygenase-like cupin family protein [Limibacillus halophilus]
MKFSISHAKDGGFEGSGLRGFFEYRDLGIKAATDGRVGAHVIRAVPGKHASGEAHFHGLDFQMVYVLKGWVKFWYEGVGEVMLEPGSCVHQPPGIHHREVAHSDDLELIEITLPAEFDTRELDAAP